MWSKNLNLLLVSRKCKNSVAPVLHVYCRRRSRKTDMLSKSSSSVGHKKSQSAMRFSEHMQVDRCPQCNAVLESYDEDTVSLSIVCLATFIHREPALAAPMLLDTLQCVARYVLYSWLKCTSTSSSLLWICIFIGSVMFFSIVKIILFCIGIIQIDTKTNWWGTVKNLFAHGIFRNIQ